MRLVLRQDRVILYMSHNFLPRTMNIEQRTIKVGFTLIELLIVISIITILITIGVTSFSTSQKKARDSRRKTDLRDVQSAMEQYYSVCGYVYVTPGNNGQFGAVNCAAPAASIMPQFPSDPLSTPYVCPTDAVAHTLVCNSSSYQICTNLESESVSLYCVTNQQ